VELGAHARWITRRRLAPSLVDGLAKPSAAIARRDRDRRSKGALAPRIEGSRERSPHLSRRRLGHGLDHGERGPADSDERRRDRYQDPARPIGRRVAGSGERTPDGPVGDAWRRRLSTARPSPPPPSPDATATDDPRVRQRPGWRGAGSDLDTSVEVASAKPDAPRRVSSARTKKGDKPPSARTPAQGPGWLPGSPTWCRMTPRSRPPPCPCPGPRR
jgi:hypothetical protein